MIQWLNNWLLCMQATIEKWSTAWFDLRDHVVFSWPSGEDIRTTVTLTLFISPPQFVLALEATLLGFHGDHQSSSAPVVSSLGLALPLALLFGFKAILSGCEFSLCKICWVYHFPWLVVFSIFLSSSSWLVIAWGLVFTSYWVYILQILFMIVLLRDCLSFQLTSKNCF